MGTTEENAGRTADADTDTTGDADTDERIDTGEGTPVLSASELSVAYGKVAALRGIDLQVGTEEIVSVIGPNGAGKSTLANTISGFLDYEGSVRYRGAEVADRTVNALVTDGLIHCTETRDLFGYMSVGDTLRLGAYHHGGDAGDRLEYVYDLFSALAERTDQHAP